MLISALRNGSPILLVRIGSFLIVLIGSDSSNLPSSPYPQRWKINGVQKNIQYWMHGPIEEIIEINIFFSIQENQKRHYKIDQKAAGKIKIWLQ